MFDAAIELSSAGARGAQPCTEGSFAFIDFGSRGWGSINMVASFCQSAVVIIEGSPALVHFQAMANQQHHFRLRAPPNTRRRRSHICAILAVSCAKAATALVIKSFQRAASSALASPFCLVKTWPWEPCWPVSLLQGGKQQT